MLTECFSRGKDMAMKMFIVLLGAAVMFIGGCASTKVEPVVYDMESPPSAPVVASEPEPIVPEPIAPVAVAPVAVAVTAPVAAEATAVTVTTRSSSAQSTVWVERQRRDPEANNLSAEFR